MKYLFVLGRNVELSIAEVKGFLKRKDIIIKTLKKIKNAILVETDKHIHEKIIDKLGGVIAFGEVVDIHTEELYFGTSNKMNYVIWDFSENSDKIREHLKRRLKAEGLKASEKKLGRMIVLQDGETASTLSTRHIDEQFFVFEEEFGRINQVCDYEEIEKRDMNKPVRRSELSISPRLSKIMINLSEAKHGRVVDAFCGIGAILYEALLQRIPVIGIDNNREALEGARQNLEWGKFNPKDYKLIKADSRKVEINNAEVLVSEPDLGEILRKMPSSGQAEATLKRFESLMIKVINNLKKSISGRIVFSSPYIKTNKGRLGCDSEGIAEKTGKELILDIPEFRENQIVGRRIVVLE